MSKQRSLKCLNSPFKTTTASLYSGGFLQIMDGQVQIIFAKNKQSRVDQKSTTLRGFNNKDQKEIQFVTSWVSQTAQ